VCAVVEGIEVVGDRRAEEAFGKRVIGVAAKLDRPAVLDGDNEPASVGTVVRADGADGGQPVLHVVLRSLPGARTRSPPRAAYPLVGVGPRSDATSRRLADNPGRRRTAEPASLAAMDQRLG